MDKKIEITVIFQIKEGLEEVSKASGRYAPTTRCSHLGNCLAPQTHYRAVIKPKRNRQLSSEFALAPSSHV